MMLSVFWVPVTAKLVTDTIGAATVSAAGCGLYRYGVYGYIRAPKEVKTLQDVFAACGLCNTNKAGKPIPWHIRKIEKRNFGTMIVLKFPLGRTYTEVHNKAEIINTALGVEASYVREGNTLIIHIPYAPLPSYLPFSRKLLQLTRGGWKFVVGLSGTDWVVHDFDTRPHLLIGSETRGGKSILLRLLIATMYLSHPRDEVEFIGVDLKPRSLEFSQFPGVWTKLISDPQVFLKTLYEFDKDMEERATDLANERVTNVQAYKEATGKTFKRRFLIIDEYGAVSAGDAKTELAIKKQLSKVTAQGAGLGIHVILCTQRPDADLVDPQLRANMGSAVGFQTTTEGNSRVILGHGGLEKLPNIRGRGVYKGEQMYVVQVPIISDEKLRRIIPDAPLGSAQTGPKLLTNNEVLSPKVVTLDGPRH